MGQLVCEEYPVDNLAYVYTYDKAGNIIGKYEFPYYQGTLAGDYLNYLTQYKVTLGSYTYSSSSWGDMLTNYNGTTITYDAIGNPSNWRNAASMSWDKRELSSLTLAQNETLSFTYNSSGIRTKKEYINYNEQYSVTHNYLLDGSTILKETVVRSSVSGATTDILYYYYDESGVSGFEYNGAKYHYIKNLQGDIVEIYDANGIRAVQYTYDAWGNVLSVTGSLASTVGQINPFRYRGYYYDSETGFYYLQSRYYDPTVGRFLNAYGIIGANGGILGYNMFAYCSNNPIMMTDYSGYGFFGDIGDWFEDTWDDTCEWASDTWDDTCEWASDTWDDTCEVVSCAWDTTCEWVDDNFGAALYEADEAQITIVDNMLCSVEAGARSTTLISGDDNKPIVFYCQNASEVWKLWEYEIGVQINTCSGGRSFGLGIASVSIESCYNETSVGLELGLETSISVAESVDYQNHTADSHLKLSIKPVGIVAIILSTYGVPIEALPALI